MEHLIRVALKYIFINLFILKKQRQTCKIVFHVSSDYTWLGECAGFCFEIKRKASLGNATYKIIITRAAVVKLCSLGH